MIKYFCNFFNKKGQNEQMVEPVYVTKHSITNQFISKNALKVIKHINTNGYKAYLVGGAVRDILQDIAPKDFDVATDAKPEKIKQLFKNSFLIGRRFRLAHIKFGREVIEVATFRGNCNSFSSKKRIFDSRGLLLRDNVYGNISDDVWRRDFTVNSLYYCPQESMLIDYTGGIKDLAKKQMRVIGDPAQRYAEDPVRMIRAIRYAVKLDFTIEKNSSKAIIANNKLILNIAAERLFIEVVKTFYGGFGLKSFNKMHEYGFINLLFPQLSSLLVKNKLYPHAEELISRAMYNTDRRYKEGKSLSNTYLFVVLLWPVVQAEIAVMDKEKGHYMVKVNNAIKNTIETYSAVVAIPKNVFEVIADVWLLQFNMINREKEKVDTLLNNNKFRMAYDFLMLRAQAGEEIHGLASWWHNFYAADNDLRAEMLFKHAERIKQSRAFARKRHSRHKNQVRKVNK